MTTDNLGIDLTNETFKLPNGLAIKVPRLVVPPHGLLVLVGPNGGGKTSLAHWLCGLRPERPTLPGGWPTLVWQRPQLYPGTTEDNVRLALFGDKGKWAKDGDVDKLIQHFEIRPYLRNAATKLSEGQAQRVNLARAFLAPGSGLVLDEPTVSLDIAGFELLVRAIGAFLKPQHLPPEFADLAPTFDRARPRRRVVICVTHDRRFIHALAPLKPRFAAIDPNTRNAAATVDLIDAGPDGAGYDIRVRPPSLFWAEFFDSPNLLFVINEGRVTSPLQLRHSRIGTNAFVTIAPNTITLSTTKPATDPVEARVVEVDQISDEIRYCVQYSNNNSQATRLWVSERKSAGVLHNLDSVVYLKLPDELRAQQQHARHAA